MLISRSLLKRNLSILVLGQPLLEQTLQVVRVAVLTSSGPIVFCQQAQRLLLARTDDTLHGGFQVHLALFLKSKPVSILSSKGA